MSKCQCEHAAHLDRTVRTPNGNPGHWYGQEFVAVVAIPARGVFEVCSDCSADCYAVLNLCTTGACTKCGGYGKTSYFVGYKPAKDRRDDVEVYSPLETCVRCDGTGTEPLT